jgi:hypothetical protein
MFFINASLATFVIGDGDAAEAASNRTSFFADIHFILISLISLFNVFIVSIKYLMMYPDNKIKINTNKSIPLRYFASSLLKERYKK